MSAIIIGGLAFAAWGIRKIIRDERHDMLPHKEKYNLHAQQFVEEAHPDRREDAVRFVKARGRAMFEDK